MGYLKHLCFLRFGSCRHEPSTFNKKNPVQINEQDLYLFADFVVLVRGFGLWFWIGVLVRVTTNQL